MTATERVQENRNRLRMLGINTYSVTAPNSHLGYMGALGSIKTGEHLFNLIGSHDIEILELVSDKPPRVGWSAYDLAEVKSAILSEEQKAALDFLLQIENVKAELGTEAKQAAAQRSEVMTMYYYAYEYALVTYARGVWRMLVWELDNPNRVGEHSVLKQLNHDYLTIDGLEVEDDLDGV